MEGDFYFFHRGKTVYINIVSHFVGYYHRICVCGVFRECETSVSCEMSKEDIQKYYRNAQYISHQEIDALLRRRNAQYVWEKINKIIEMEENQMKVIILTNGNSAIVKTVENVDIEKIKTEYPGWEISTPTSETGEIKLEAKAYGYDYSFAEIKVVG